MKLSNDIHVYVKSMGKIFRVKHIARDVDEANEFCLKRNNRDCGVIAEDRITGLIFIAEKNAMTVPSDVLPD